MECLHRVSPPKQQQKNPPKPKHTSKIKPQIFSGLCHRLSMAIGNRTLLGSQLQLSMAKPQVLSPRLSLLSPPCLSELQHSSCSAQLTDPPPKRCPATTQPWSCPKSRLLWSDTIQRSSNSEEKPLLTITTFVSEPPASPKLSPSIGGCTKGLEGEGGEE